MNEEEKDEVDTSVGKNRKLREVISDNLCLLTGVRSLSAESEEEGFASKKSL